MFSLFAIVGQAITDIMVIMAKMQITSENGFEKDGSYEKLRPKQKNMQKKGNFWAISFVKLVES